MAEQIASGATNRPVEIIKGAVVALLLVAILLLVPVAGVRKDVKLMVLNWQELVLYVTCISVGLVSGAYYFSKPKQPSMDSDKESRQISGASAVGEDGDKRIESVKETSTPKIEESSGDVIHTEPVIEESLAGGPKKKENFFLAKRKFAFSKGTGRTKSLLVYLYLVLYVNCAILCQKLKLGSIVAGNFGGELLRSAGLAVTLAGLYLILKGMFSSRSNPNDTISGDTSKEASGQVVPSLAPHVPPTKMTFLKNHPVCAGWLVVLTGVPLVFQAWFPLIAIPGVFVAMNWLFRESK